MNQLLLPGNAPFVVAIGLMVVIGVLEALALLLGLALSQQADSFLVTHFALDHTDASAADASAIGQVLGWLHVGRVPLLMLVVLFLMGFAISGLVLQWVIAAVAGHLLPVPLAVVLATLGALPFVRATGGLVGRYFPQDESSAISELDFVGRVAQVTLGEASAGNPTQARLVDEYGQAHYLRVEPDEPGQRFPRGETVLIVARTSGTLYRAIVNPRPDLL
ncbi:OB-fold-containig protein [Cupriavidus basilensis]|uniref:OB-fold-containig protein n=1 Tax=Cupriavidus basilensis TaxID=68895 RepID=UPI0020A6B8A2|nr:OB-fold-containig protein [Cupriavidus basilensis]MCP3023276.1 YqiJ family protein [Cupriavidus basilensis]